MRRTVRLIVPIAVLAGLILAWGILRARSQAFSYESVAARAGLDRRIASVDLDNPSLQAADELLRQQTGTRLQFQPQLAGSLTEELLTIPLRLHAHLHDVRAQTVLGLVTNAAQTYWLDLESGVARQCGESGIMD